MPEQKLGVPLSEPPPTLAEPAYDIQQRDKLFARLQRLVVIKASIEAEITIIEQEIDELIEAPPLGGLDIARQSQRSAR